ncbi:MAG TPA: hypothetical protein HPP97_05495 [Desulfuromonadales bacterium]|nr:hypothetical protein [Desulfuromonadales bacterium]
MTFFISPTKTEKLQYQHGENAAEEEIDVEEYFEVEIIAGQAGCEQRQEQRDGESRGVGGD